MADVEIRGAMDRNAMNAFLNAPVLARIATVRGDWPHVVPMWFDWDGVGAAIPSSPKYLR